MGDGYRNICTAMEFELDAFLVCTPCSYIHEFMSLYFHFIDDSPLTFFLYVFF